MTRMRSLFPVVALAFACALRVMPASAAPCPGSGSFDNWLSAFKQEAASSGVGTRGLAGPAGDIAALTRRLDRVRVVVLADERDGLGTRDAVEDGQAGQCGAGTPVAAFAGDLDPFGRGALPGFGQRGHEPVRRHTADAVVAVDAEYRCVRDAGSQRQLAGGSDDGFGSRGSCDVAVLASRSRDPLGGCSSLHACRPRC